MAASQRLSCSSLHSFKPSLEACTASSRLPLSYMVSNSMFNITLVSMASSLSTGSAADPKLSASWAALRA
eukprot:CAMPEP_0114679464 /NCGR_PEP_ID=MMETSP0191-20121206/52943_1 /TAXON_ID=126664 /ORGANISM="Sorites sp." /LENGTH=69 /DNA_ID=CAMNT_0001954851 /DNA_START=16 /DNA_END=221 /DNA_ORIENTATION=-